MRPAASLPLRGFTLIEMLTALLLLSLLALMSYRGLVTVLDAREQLRMESDKWRRITNFLVRFERDVTLASPRSARVGTGRAPAWHGSAGTGPALGPGGAGNSSLAFSRFAADAAGDRPQRLAYRLNDRQEIELWLWPGLDMATEVLPSRYPVLTGVTRFEVRYMNGELSWVPDWPPPALNTAIPHAVQLRIVLESGEAIERVFALKS